MAQATEVKIPNRVKDFPDKTTTGASPRVWLETRDFACVATPLRGGGRQMRNDYGWVQQVGRNASSIFLSYGVASQMSSLVGKPPPESLIPYFFACFPNNLL